MPALTNQLVNITAADIQALVDKQWPEDETLELKRTLTQSSSGTPDRWLSDQSDVGQAAKRDALAEVVAMANSYGGDVILGIEETPEKPPRAHAIHPLPRCVELAARLEMAARDLIKPQVPMLSVRGIPVDGSDGVVVFRVPRSRLAPHRLEIKGVVKECYRRVSDRTEPMSMREIQDLTFAVARGLDTVDAYLERATREFTTWYQAGQSQGRRRGFMIAALPLSADLYLERVHGNQAVQAVSTPYRARLSGSGPFQLELYPVAQPYNYRPVLRGTEAEEGNADNRTRLQRVYCDGAVLDFSRVDSAAQDTPGQRSDHALYPGWFFASVANVFETIDRFRSAVNGQPVQYAMQICVAATAPCKVYRWNDQWHDTAGTFPGAITTFPRYQLWERDTWSDTLTLLHRDFWNAIGVEDGAGTRFEIEGW